MGTLAAMDGPALAERAYHAAIDGAVATHFAKQAKKGAAVPAYASLEAEQKIDVLMDLVAQQAGAAPEIPEPPEPPAGTPRAEAKALRATAAVEFLEQAVRSGVVVPDSAMNQLAETRALAVERALLGSGELDPTRVFKVREGKVSGHEGKVRFELGLK
jgi:hypothetical protein